MARTTPEVAASAVDFPKLIAQRLNEALALHPSVNNQVQLEASSGVRQSTISKVLRGEAEPSISTLYALANGLGLPLTTLLEDVPVVPSRFLQQRDAALTKLAPLPRAFVEVLLRVIGANGLSDADCAKLIGEWGAKLPAERAS
jgi:transcriptional regulator with XRE-family HTH domain